MDRLETRTDRLLRVTESFYFCVLRVARSGLAGGKGWGEKGGMRLARERRNNEFDCDYNDPS
jgi:hypothetical protein